MDDKRLMIGDWIKVTTDHEIPPFQIGRITSDEVTQINGAELDFCISDVEPIPLTKKMLVPYIDCDPDNHVPDGYIFGGLIGMIWDGNGLDCGITAIRYVHELQHILRICGLDELADNFKVI